MNLDSISGKVNSFTKSSEKRVLRFCNEEKLILYWDIGKSISSLGVEDIKSLSYKVNYSYEELINMKNFYNCYSNWQDVCKDLSWLHYLELIKIEDKVKREYFKRECARYKWSVEELKNKIFSS